MLRSIGSLPSYAPILSGRLSAGIWQINKQQQGTPAEGGALQEGGLGEKTCLKQGLIINAKYW